MAALRLLACLSLFLCAGFVEADVLGVFRPYKPGTTDYLRLQDFCIFRCGGYKYVASMKKDYCNQGILIARSTDLNSWKVLGDAVKTRTPEDAAMVWAPHVAEDNGTYHMFYTGVTVPTTGAWCQRILVASTTDPSNPANWQRNYSVQFVVDGQTQSWFRPSHPGAVWTSSGWADCRDPMVLKYNGTWYLFYSGMDTDGGITGVATAPNVLGPWTDQGAVFKVAPASIPESCFVLQAPDGGFVMITNHAGGIGASTARGRSLVPVNGLPTFFGQRVLSDTTGTPLPGWAHEFLPANDGALLCAYLSGYYVTFRDAYFHGETWGWTVADAPTPNKCAYGKTLPDATAFALRGKVVSGVFADGGYVQEPDRASGIRVMGVSGVAAGDVVKVSGTAGLDGKEAVLKNGYIGTAVHGEKPGPLGISNREMANGPPTTGLLVRTTGKVTYVDPNETFAYIDDGANLSDGSGHTGVRMSLESCPVPALGAQAAVTGCCVAADVGGKCAAYLRPRSTGDVSFSAIETYLHNRGFEIGVFAPWVYSGGGGDIRTGTWYAVITPHSGNKFFGAYAYSATCAGTLVQSVSVPNGNYSASAWSRVFHSYNDPMAAAGRIGIDPSGGIDPNSPNVVWSAWDTQSRTAFSEWHQIATPSVAVSGGVCTVFLQYAQQFNSGHHMNCFDDVVLGPG